MSAIYNERAYAKVNLGLRVLQKREDGFHPLKTIFHKIDLFDDITLKISDSNKLKVQIFGNEEYIGLNVDLMEKACILFSDKTNIYFDIEIKIDKKIPFQAGLGGGSSDCATVLLTLNKHFNNVLTKVELLKIALMLGSDVPFFITGFDAAYGEGRGELLKEAEGVSYPIVILKKKGSLVSTKEAFKKLDERNYISSDFPAWPLELKLWKNNLVNDFDIIQPIRAEDEFKKLSLNASFDSTCGSGSCQFLVFESNKQLNNFLSLRCSYEMLVTKLRKSTLH